MDPTQYLESRTLLTTGLVKDIHPTFNSTPLDIVDVNGTIFFSADDGTHGRELWKSDGTAGGTVLVKDINPGPNGSLTPLPNASRINFLTNVNGILYFVADDGVHGNELWKSDGTEAGTVMVKDIDPTSVGSISFGPEELVNLNGTLYFYANDGVHGEELWRSDGTEAGTVMVKDIYVGSFGSVSESFFSSGLRIFKGMLIFGADNGFANGEELWVSDGTTNGTVMLKDLTGDFFSSSPDDFTVVGDTMFFTARDNTHGTELWKTDGTAAGTLLVKDIVPGFFGPNLIELTAVGNTLFFAANTSDAGYELWKSDGTDAGTVMVKDIRPGMTGSIFGLDDSFRDMNGTLFFAADDGVNGEEIWKSDGTAAGTVLVKDIYPGTPGSYTGLPIVVGNNYYFQAFTITDGFELWRTDGTEQGTVMLRNIDPNFRATVPVTAEFLTNVNGIIYFQATDDELSTWTELWRFDTSDVEPPPPPPGNHAPVLDPDGFPTLPATTKVDANLGISIPDLIASMGPDGGITDVDANAVQGIAIIGRNNLNGTWEFTIDGGNFWQPLGTVSTTSARLLASNPQTRVRFVPISTYVGNSGITYLAWDQTSGVNGGLADTSIRGGSSAFSTKKEHAYVTIIDNHAPILNPNGSPKLPDYANSGGPNPGMLIDDLIAAMGPNGGITDVDTNAQKGIAIIGANNVVGAWEYSINNGTSWSTVGPATSLAARLLAANGATRLRFVPKPGFVGTVGLTFLAWDQTDGSNGGTGNTAYRGKTAAYSQQKEDVFITITGNRAPILNPAGNPKLPDLPHNPSTNNGMLISDLIASMGPNGGITDPDPAALKGIAIIGANNVVGAWEFSTNNGTSWSAVGSTSSLSARLLAADATTRIRFVPKPGFVGTIGFTFLAWDRTSGANGGLAGTLLRGGTTSFSNDKDNAYITIT